MRSEIQVRGVNGNMIFLERLKLAARHSGVGESQAEIATSLKLSRQTVNRWFKGGSPNRAMISTIAQTWGVNAEWLASGTGTLNGVTAPKDATEDELELLATYRSATAKVRKIILSIAKAARKA